MPRAARVVILAAAFATCLSVARVASPGPTLACSCAEPKPLAAYVDEPGSIVVAGDVGTVGPDSAAPFMVRQVFFGGMLLLPQAVLAPHDAGICSPTIVSNESVVFVGSHEDGVIRPKACAPYAETGTPEGQQLLAEAAATFGRPDAGESASGSDAGNGPLLLIAAAIAALTIGLFGAVAFRSRRGRGAT